MTEEGFTIEFDSAFSVEERSQILAALEDYWEACGGRGFEVEWEGKEDCE